VLLVFTAFLINIDWTRPKIEAMMSESFHRKVKLGALSWTLGLNGISIWTNQLTASGEDGEPFVRSGPSEIGVAFLPLLNGKLIVRHLSFKRPELWAIRLNKSTWNFSDLLKPGLDIRLIQVEKGKLHLQDRSADSKTAFKPYYFENIKLKLVWPREDRRWPFYLSFNLPRPDYTTHVKLTTLGYGLFERWRHNDYKFDLSADNLNPDDLGPLRHLLPDISGLFAINIEGEGALSKGVVAKASADIERLSVQAGNLGKLRAPAASSSARLHLSEDKLTWDDLSVKLGDVELRSSGQLADWQGKSPHYQARVSSRVADLSRLPEVTATPMGRVSRMQRTTTAGDISRLLTPGRLAGTAMIEVSVSGTGPVSEFLATIGADGLPAKEIVGAGFFGPAPFLDLVGLDARSKLSGKLKIANGRLDVPEAEMMAAGGVVKASGFWDQESGHRHVNFNGIGLRLAALAQRLAASKDLSAQFVKFCHVPSVGSLSLGGSMDLSGEVDSDNPGQAKLAAVLKSASFALKDGSLTCEQVKGRIRFDGRALHFDDLSGSLGSGDFKLNGTTMLAGAPYIDVTLTANRLDLDHLDRALKLLQIDVPVFAGRQLYGKVREFVLSIKGDPNRPTMAMSAQPEDLYYQPPGLSRALRAVSGSLIYDHDRLTLRDVGLLGLHGRKLITSLAIDELSGAAKLKRVKAKTTGLDLSDVHFYLSSPLMPPPLRQGYLETLARYRLTAVSGTAYGDMLWQSRDADFDLSGVIGFYNVRFRAGSPAFDIDGLSGLLAASGRELIIQNMGGHIGSSTFTVDGHVTDYRSPQATWQTELRSQLSPQEFLDLVPGLGGQVSMKVSSSHPVSLRATISGNPTASTVIFSARADAKTRLSLGSPIGSLYQPADKAVTLDGSFTITPGPAGNLILHNSHLLIGDSILQGQGSYAWSPPNGNNDAILSFRLNSPNPITAKSLLAVLDPSTNSSGVKGTVSIDLQADGPVTQPLVKGHVSLHDVSLPQFNLDRLTGSLHTDGFVLSLSPSAGTAGSRADLDIKTIAIGDLTANDIAAKIVVEPAATPDQAPRIKLDSGIARIAGGTMQLGGWLELVNHRLHIDAKLAGVESGQIVGQLLGQPDEIIGSADGSIVLDSEGVDYNALIRNLDGRGEISVASGRVMRFGRLQEKLTQANLLQQGLFGFNLNNLLQSVVPVRTGYFKDLHGRFDIADGLLSIKDVRFNGEDMRLRAAGTVNLPLNTIAVEVAGNLPRVSSSLIGGPLGQVSREFTLQKLMRVITMNKLENLPPVPVLGDIASDRPRAFTFRVATTMDRPQAIAHSIEKSFRWLPNQTNATAHPIPGLH